MTAYLSTNQNKKIDITIRSYNPRKAYTRVTTPTGRVTVSGIVGVPDAVYPGKTLFYPRGKNAILLNTSGVQG